MYEPGTDTESHREILPALETESLEGAVLLVRDDDLSIRDDTEVNDTGSLEYAAPEETVESPVENMELVGYQGEPSQFAERAVLPHECGACVGPVPHMREARHHRARVCVPAPAAPLPGTTVVMPAPVAPRPTTTIVGVPAPVAPRPMTTTIIMPAAAPTLTTVLGAPPPAVVPAMPTTTVVAPVPAPVEPRPMPVPIPVPAPAPAPAPMPVPVPVPVPGHHEDDDATKAVPKVVERMPLLKVD